ncbi:MAG: hypothetical protein LBE36_07510 [Flavobacteriaceae bacterium]|jgi:hypothetical protein|nr:hypothetical protein [Flavobacteriaceae bacterium]
MVPILLTSCATFMNKPYTAVTVHTTEPSKIIYQNDTLETINNRAELFVERKKDTLLIVAKTDSLTKSVSVKPRLSFMYWSSP